MSSATPLISTRRPLPLQARRDLAFERMTWSGEPCWIVRDPLSLHYVRLTPEQHRTLELLDGQRSLEQIRDELRREFPMFRPSLAEIQSLILDLHRKHLALGNRTGQADELLRRERERKRSAALAALRNILYIRVPGWDPSRTLDWLYPPVRWLFHPLVVLACLGMIAGAWLLLAVHFHEFQQRLPAADEFLSWRGSLSLWLTLGGAKVIHELAHGLTCRHFGGRCHEIGVSFLIFSPCMYCDVSDAWMLPEKRKRILISMAGMYVELLLSALALLGWWFTRPGQINALCLNLFLVTTLSTILFNANPLLRLDGYYIASDLLDIPNLRARAEQHLLRAVARVTFGASPGTVAEPARLGLMAYAVAAAAYRWTLALVMIGIFCRLLKPYGLEWIGFLFGAGSFVVLAVQAAAALARQRPDGERPAGHLRSAILAAGTMFLCLLLLRLPMPLHDRSALQIEPARAQHVYAATPGRLTEICVRPGQRVRRGEPLLRLANYETEERCRQLETAEALQGIEVALQRSLGDAGQEQIARGALDAVREQLTDCRTQLAELVVVAPCDGVVLESLPRPAPPPGGGASGTLPGWSGTPLDPANLGCRLERGTHLLTIAGGDTRDYEVALHVEAEQRGSLAVGQGVDVRLEHRPWQSYRGRVESIAPQQLEFVPPGLAERHGGDLPTRTDFQSLHRPEQNLWRVTARLDAPHQNLLLPGLRGLARIDADRGTLGDWLSRELRALLRHHF